MAIRERLKDRAAGVPGKGISRYSVRNTPGSTLANILKKCKLENPHILSTHDEEIIDQEDKRNIIAHVVVDGNVIKTNEDEINEISKLKSILKEEFGDCEYHIFIDKDYKNGNN